MIKFTDGSAMYCSYMSYAPKGASGYIGYGVNKANDGFLGIAWLTSKQVGEFFGNSEDSGKNKINNKRICKR
ncbi:hypothetical protein [Ruminiclostridium cellobioparum]|uniref:hypothetical protein n=1 Tax=Ruminiclostridium cellobioparum TaxID=29355 RepID=UPI0005950728|nr:hypothetical protein [Ruminiclostridium cellobioparum]